MSQVKQSVDLRGLVCPEPVIRTKKLFDNAGTSSVEALVDDDVCVNNLKRLARSIKASFRVTNSGGYFTVTLERPAASQTEALAGQPVPHAHEAVKDSAAAETDGAAKAGTIIFLGKDKFGDGDEEFSKTLLNLFLQTIFESGLKPRAILMANSGVKLLAANSPALKVLSDFKADGCEVLACGLCVDFYKLKDQVPKEQITNMFAICEYMFAAEKVLQP
jgi:selenium metabolism protein YedF